MRDGVGAASVRASGTSLERTYRNLRLAIAGTVLAIAAGVVVASMTTGVLGSISAYYYTPARDLFVGGLVAAALALLALSGRGVQRVLIDAAGIVAPLIALVPTPLAAGAVPGIDVVCAAGRRCLPPAVLPQVAVGVTVYLLVGAMAVIAAAVWAARRGALAEVLPSLVAGAVVLLAVGAGWMFDREAFLATAHLVAAVVFFALIGALAAVNAFGRPDPLGAVASPALRRAYAVIAIALVVDLAVTAIAALTGHADDTRPAVLLVGESVALALFATFWLLQSAQRWNDPDPAVLGPSAVPS